MDLKTHKREWEELADFDDLWAVLTTTEKRGGRWDLDEFFASGNAVIDAFVLKPAAEIGHPERWGSVLDFGCGVGRVAPALSSRFENYTGVDVSENMITEAQRLHAERPNCEFAVNSAADLSAFGDDSFDMVFSVIVLQHLPDREAVEGYLREFARVSRPGGLIMAQVPSYIPPIYRLGIRAWGYKALRRLGVSPERAIKLGMNPMRMTAVPADAVHELFESSGCDVLRADTVDIGQGMRSTTTYATRR